MAEDNGFGLEDLSLENLQSIEPQITNDVLDVLSVENSLKSRTSFGGTAPNNVVAACAEARRRFLKT
jgi:argininosuccinate lyase